MLIIVDYSSIIRIVRDGGSWLMFGYDLVDVGYKQRVFGMIYRPRDN